MIEYALNATPRHGDRRSVMSHDQPCPGPVASSTGASRGGLVLPLRVGATGRAVWSSMSAATRHQDRREPSITPASQASANVWSTDTPSAQPAVINAAIASRSAGSIRDGYARSLWGTGLRIRVRGLLR